MLRTRGSLSARCVCVLFSLLVASLPQTGCKRSSSTSSYQAENAAPSGSLELVFTYGSEKENWIKDVTDSFNRSGNKTASGQRIFVRAIPMGSGESIEDILSGATKAHITSPASGAFITLGNAESRAKTGQDLVGSTENLVLSPVVIAMWKPMAEAIGYGKKPIGWTDILALARSDRGWAQYGFPQWGSFKFGHTHPEYSNSGLISVIAEVYAANKKTAGLTLNDVQSARTADFVRGVEHSVVHYGSSTGFFGRKMFAAGPQYLSAAVLYESMVIESYGKNLQFPVVAIYPKEGTFWSDHPIGVVNREWVTPAHKEAAQIYTKYLLARPQQERAMTYGFRPGAVDIPLASPIDAAHGVDPKEPKTTLEVPSAEVIHAILQTWKQDKKNADVVLVLDTSGSMNEDQKMQNAREGAKQLVSMLDDSDTFSLLPFSTRMNWAFQDLPVKTERQHATDTVSSLFADGGTALYDSIDAAYKHLLDKGSGNDHIRAVVVLTDGADTESQEKLEDLLQHLQQNSEQRPISIFSIAYGKDARRDVLQKISEATQARMYEGTPKNIVEVFREISTFF
ncbi:MAG TPA: extracellular solute-binding protein [Terriglobales bacterium]|jgi:Ca-activated chloride channel family protein|nr:extracellular solute-binding protein [Terriglobales bacterium]